MTAALLALLLWAGDWREPMSLIRIPLILGWTAGPMIAAYFRTAGAAPPERIAVMGAFSVLAAATSALAYGEAFFFSSSSTASLILVFLPPYLWAAFLLAVALCAVVEWVVRRRKRSEP